VPGQLRLEPAPALKRFIRRFQLLPAAAAEALFPPPPAAAAEALFPPPPAAAAEALYPAAPAAPAAAAENALSRRFRLLLAARAIVGCMATIAIIGDVGGCLARLTAAVDALDDPDAIVIQVGDLIDRGPDSPGVLSYVDGRLQRAGGGRWVQLIGNHDAQYLGAEPFWPERLPDADADRLRGWWLRDRLQVAAAVRTADGEELLVTHAGLTPWAWSELDEPVTASTAAALLNPRPEPLLWHTDGPLWTEAPTGLYPGWLESGPPMPFSQVHGHSTIVDWDSRAWRCRERIRDRSTVDWEARHTVTRAGGARFIAIDPRHGRLGAPAWSPLVLRDAVLLD